MKSFQQYLSEGMFTDLSELIMKGAIPFSEKMWNRITGTKAINMYGIHVTDMDDLDIVVDRMVGTKKQLSVMTDPSESWAINIARGAGVLSDGGVILTVQGDIIAEFGEDIASYRDEQGRRWVETSFNMSFTAKDEWMDFIGELHERIYDEVITKQNENPEIQAKYKTEIPDYMEDGTEYWRSDDIRDLEDLFNRGFPLEKRAVIIMYMEEVEKELKKEQYQKSIANMFKYGGQVKFSGADKWSGRDKWDEKFMINTQILKAMLVVDSPGINLPLQGADKWLNKHLPAIRKIKKVEYYHSKDKPVYSALKKEAETLQKLNGRIKLNLSKKFDFPVEYLL